MEVAMLVMTYLQKYEFRVKLKCYVRHLKYLIWKQKYIKLKHR